MPKDYDVKLALEEPLYIKLSKMWQVFQPQPPMVEQGSDIAVAKLTVSMAIKLLKA